MNYTVTFIQYHVYSVEADNDDEAENKAYEQFSNDMRSPIAQNWYDEIEIECDEE